MTLNSYEEALDWIHETTSSRNKAWTSSYGVYDGKAKSSGKSE